MRRAVVRITPRVVLIITFSFVIRPIELPFVSATPLPKNASLTVSG